MTSEESPDSKFCYHGTRDPVRLGDRVRVRRFLRRAEDGVVCYIPGTSPLHRELEYGGMRHWAIQRPDGSLLVMGYAPHQCGPRRGIELVSRGAALESLDPGQQLESPPASDEDE